MVYKLNNDFLLQGWWRGNGDQDCFVKQIPAWLETTHEVKCWANDSLNLLKSPPFILDSHGYFLPGARMQSAEAIFWSSCQEKSSCICPSKLFASSYSCTREKQGHDFHLGVPFPWVGRQTRMLFLTHLLYLSQDPTLSFLLLAVTAPFHVSFLVSSHWRASARPLVFFFFFGLSLCDSIHLVAFNSTRVPRTLPLLCTPARIPSPNFTSLP